MMDFLLNLNIFRLPLLCRTGKVSLSCLGGSSMIPHPLAMGGLGLSGCCGPINNQWSTVTTIVQQHVLQPQLQYQAKPCCQSCICQPYQKLPSKFPSVGPKNYGYPRYGPVPSYDANAKRQSNTIAQVPSYGANKKPNSYTITVV